MQVICRDRKFMKSIIREAMDVGLDSHWQVELASEGGRPEAG
jgi:hypothetical protein